MASFSSGEIALRTGSEERRGVGTSSSICSPACPGAEYILIPAGLFGSIQTRHGQRKEDALESALAPVLFDSILKLERGLQPDFELDALSRGKDIDEVRVEARCARPLPQDESGVVESVRVGRERELQRLEDVVRRSRRFRHGFAEYLRLQSTLRREGTPGRSRGEGGSRTDLRRVKKKSGSGDPLPLYH